MLHISNKMSLNLKFQNPQANCKYAIWVAKYVFPNFMCQYILDRDFGGGCSVVTIRKFVYLDVILCKLIDKH
jgi:hypothetical protein